jgi:hypothetical protein
LVVDPCTFELAAVWPNHAAFAISLVEFPQTIKFCSFVCHYDVIELKNAHLTCAITFAILKIASVSISTCVLGYTITIDAALQEVAVISLGWIFLILENSS